MFQNSYSEVTYLLKLPFFLNLKTILHKSKIVTNIDMNNYIYSLGAITFKIFFRFITQKRVDTPITVYTYALNEPMLKNKESWF